MLSCQLQLRSWLRAARTGEDAAAAFAMLLVCCVVWRLQEWEEEGWCALPALRSSKVSSVLRRNPWIASLKLMPFLSFLSDVDASMSFLGYCWLAGIAGWLASALAGIAGWLASALAGIAGWLASALAGTVG